MPTNSPHKSPPHSADCSYVVPAPRHGVTPRAFFKGGRQQSDTPPIAIHLIHGERGMFGHRLGEFIIIVSAASRAANLAQSMSAIERKADSSQTSRHAALCQTQTSFHSITSSARPSRIGDSSSPIALAAFRLITSSNFVGCSTANSPGFAPLRILSTYIASRWNESLRLGP